MGDVQARLALVAAAALVGFLGVRVVRGKAARRPIRIDARGLDPGLYLLTSRTCPDCATARAVLSRALGAGGYREISWEESPALFERPGVDAVPATLVVGEGGRGVLYPGDPREALASLSP